jgi:hypothetical protein
MAVIPIMLKAIRVDDHKAMLIRQVVEFVASPLTRRRVLDLARARKLPGHPFGDVFGAFASASLRRLWQRRNKLGFCLRRKRVWYGPTRSSVGRLIRGRLWGSSNKKVG